VARPYWGLPDDDGEWIELFEKISSRKDEVGLTDVERELITPAEQAELDQAARAAKLQESGVAPEVEKIQTEKTALITLMT